MNDIMLGVVGMEQFSAHLWNMNYWKLHHLHVFDSQICLFAVTKINKLFSKIVSEMCLPSQTTQQ